MSQWTSSKTHHFRRFHAKRTSPLNSAYFFAYCSTGQNCFSTFFRTWSFLTWNSLKTILIWCFEGLGLCSNDFSKRKASDCIYQTRNRYWETQLFDVSKMIVWCLCITAMYHWYVSSMYLGYVSWVCQLCFIFALRWLFFCCISIVWSLGNSIIWTQHHLQQLQQQPQ